MTAMTGKDGSLELPILHSVRRSRVGRKLALVLGALIVALPVVLLLVPWQQTVSGSGRVVARDPRQRTQTIPAPVTGRLVKLHVQEGTRVQAGDPLVELEDQDPGYFLRLRQQLEFAQDKVDQAHESLEFYQQKVNSLRREKDSADRKARAELGAAIEKVAQAREDVLAKEAEVELDKRPNYQRQRDLLAQGNVAEKTFQSAEAALRAAEAQVRAARAKVDEALSEEQSKMAAIDEIDAKFDGSISAGEAEVRAATQKLREAQTELTNKQSDVNRQATQNVVAPTAGTVLVIHGAGSQDLISRGAPLIEFVPIADELVVELFMRGIDAPLVRDGRKARLQFEGWPAVQSPGWPSVAIGTFAGQVLLVDAQARIDGSVRVLVGPDPDSDSKWPERPFLRQGVRATGWVQLETVSVGYELWRQLNAFPPERAMAGPAKAGTGPAGAEAKSSTKEGTSK